MPTLILSGRYTKDSVSLWKAALPLGWGVERIRDWRVPPLEADSFAIYGEPLFAEVVCRALDLVLLEPALDWLAQLPSAFTNRKVQFGALADARLLNKPTFVKPADNKVFDSKVCVDASQLPAPGVFPETLPVLMADPVDWEVEFRCFALNGRVQTLSPYWRAGSLARDENEAWPATEAELSEAHQFAEAVFAANPHSLPSAVVLDVGLIKGRGWSVVEANPAWAAGFYGCDPEAILPVLSRACRRSHELTEEDRRWVVQRPPESV